MFFFSMNFYGLNLGRPEVGPFWTLGLPLEQIWQRTTRQRYIPNFKHLKGPTPDTNIDRLMHSEYILTLILEKFLYL